jgi:putative endonuclease
MYHVYVLRSLKDGRLYTGVSGDLHRRLKEHQAGKTKSLRSRRPLVLVYSEAFGSKNEALARERFFKTAEGGALKQQLVAEAAEKAIL